MLKKELILIHKMKIVLMNNLNIYQIRLRAIKKDI